MSTTAPLTQPKSIAVASLKSNCNMYLQDLRALPEDAFTKSLGGKARTVADFTYEVMLTNDHIGMLIRGEEPFPWPEADWIYAPKAWDTKAKVVAAFDESCARIISTLEGFSNEQFEETILIEGRETTRYERARFMNWHVIFHGGQLSFIQSLLGDDDMHWS